MEVQKMQAKIASREDGSLENTKILSEEVGGPLIQLELPPEDFDDNTSNPDVFARFPQFPHELRQHIWLQACYQPCIVEVHTTHLEITYERRDDDGELVLHKGRIKHYRSWTADPPLLRTCHASREVALRFYRKIFLSNPFVFDSVYFEEDIDTMYLTSEALNLWIMSTILLHAHTHPIINNAGLRVLRNHISESCPNFPAHSPPHYLLTNIRSIAMDSDWLLQFALRYAEDHLCQATLDIVKSGVMGRILSVLSAVENLGELSIVLNKDFHLGNKCLEVIKLDETDPATNTGLEYLRLGAQRIMEENFKPGHDIGYIYRQRPPPGPGCSNMKVKTMIQPSHSKGKQRISQYGTWVEALDSPFPLCLCSAPCSENGECMRTRIFKSNLREFYLFTIFS